MKSAMPNWCWMAAILTAAMLSGCNTLEGAGKDVERAGEGIQNATCTEEEKRTSSDC